MSTEQNGETFKGHTFNSQVLQLDLLLRNNPTSRLPQLNNAYSLLGSKRYQSKVWGKKV